MFLGAVTLPYYGGIIHTGREERLSFGWLRREGPRRKATGEGSGGFFLARILVVDDNPDVRLALATILEDAGHEVIEAEDGEQVFDIVLEENVDLVMLDVMMPRVSGFDALAAVKADTRTAQTPVIMVTAKGRPEDMAMARSLGAVEYITKPWADGDVELRVEWALATAQAS